MNNAAIRDMVTDMLRQSTGGEQEPMLASVTMLEEIFSLLNQDMLANALDVKTSVTDWTVAGAAHEPLSLDHLMLSLRDQPLLQAYACRVQDLYVVERERQQRQKHQKQQKKKAALEQAGRKDVEKKKQTHKHMIFYVFFLVSHMMTTRGKRCSCSWRKQAYWNM